jgi:hypothetical protein
MGISNNFIKSTAGNIDLTGITGLNTSYRYFKEGYYKFNPNQPALIVPATENKVNREIIINYREDLNPINNNDCNLYFGNKNQHPKPIKLGGGYLDTSDGGIALVAECSEPIIIEITIRQDTPINYIIGNYSLTGDDLMIPVEVRLAIGTGANFVSRNITDFDTDSTQYLINLYKLKNSDSGATGYKVFDIVTFYPGKPITFHINITNLVNYGNIAIQLFDPISVGEAIFDIANDVVNFELNNLSDSFIGNVTRGALYKDIDVVNSEITITPDFSRHTGRFVAINQSTGKYDTAIIESYTPNNDPLLGGIFTLTGDF